MTDTRMQESGAVAPTSEDSRGGWLAAGGLLGGVLAASCCIVPLALVTLGVSGAWIGQLTVLEPYKPYFAAVAVLFVGLGFCHVYLRPRAACVDGSFCERPQSSRVTKAVLWLATALVVLAITVSWWAPLFY